MPKIFDSHSHYDSRQFDADRDALLRSMNDKGVGLIMSVGSNIESSKQNSELSKKYPFVFASAGVHPIDCKSQSGDYISELKGIFADNKKVVAVGEIGLDYHYDTPKVLQKIFLEQQLLLARELDKPVILHFREATADMLSVLKEFRPNGVVHCFSGSVETAKAVLDLGLYIGFTGVVTFKNAAKVQKTAAYVPLDRMLIETDCPYMAPVPFRGQRCDSSLLYSIADKLGELKGVSRDEIIQKTYQNAVSVYRLEEFL